MFQRLCNLRKNRKGFTLVELIVVLVILAILAALLIPALTGYIDRAKEKSIIAETRQIVMAAQTVADEAYGEKATVASADLSKADVTKLSEVTLASGESGDVISVGTQNGVQGKVVYVKHTKGGKTCYYDGSTYEVDPTTAPTKPTGAVDFGA